MLNRTFSFLLAFVLLTSCKTLKQASNAENNETLNSAAAMRSIQGFNASIPEHTQLRAKVLVKVGDDEQNLRANFYIQKDSIIWANFSKFGISGARFFAQPNRVQFYNRIDQQFADEPYSELANLLPQSLDLFQIQSLILGRRVPPKGLNSENSKFEIVDERYKLKQIEEGNIHAQYIYDLNFRLNSMNVEVPNENLNMNATFADWIAQGEYEFPGKANIKLTGKKNISMELTFTNVQLEAYSAPFQIPSGYQKIKLFK